MFGGDLKLRTISLSFFDCEFGTLKLRSMEILSQQRPQKRLIMYNSLARTLVPRTTFGIPNKHIVASRNDYTASNLLTIQPYACTLTQSGQQYGSAKRNGLCVQWLSLTSTGWQPCILSSDP